MSSQLSFIPYLSVTQLDEELRSILNVDIVVLPSRFVEHGSFLPPSREPYPELHVTLQYPLKHTSPVPMDFFRLSSPTPKRPYWYHVFRMDIPIAWVQQRLRVKFWLSSPSAWQHVATRDKTVFSEPNVRPARGRFLLWNSS